MKLLSTILVAVSVSVLAGCSSTGGSKDTDVQIEDRSGSSSGSDSGATTSGVQGYGGLGAQSLGDPNSPLSQRVIYFAYDSSKVEDEDRDLVAAHAAYLSANSDVKVSVEGHTPMSVDRANIILHSVMVARRPFAACWSFTELRLARLPR